MSDEGKTFQEILSENLAQFQWNIPADNIPDYDTTRRLFQRVFDWANKIDEETWIVLDEVNLAPGLAKAGFFDEWSDMSTIFDGPSFGTNTATLRNYITCFNNAFERHKLASEG
jgi:hypothetical protein